MRVFWVVLAIWLPMAALAHNVIASVFPSGPNIEGEIGFSNGDMAADTVVSVVDDTGAPLGETKTDADGFFLFAPTVARAHIFRADLGAGHVAEVRMSAQEVADILGQSAMSIPAAPIPAAMPTAAPDADIRAALRAELRPLRQEITALRSKARLMDALGGIGYIIGLFGVGFYLAARRKLAEGA